MDYSSTSPSALLAGATRTSLLFAVATTVAVTAACKSDDSGSASDAGTTTGAATDDAVGESDPPGLTSDFEPVCEPGVVRCAGQGVLETCASTGAGWDADPCPNNTECMVCEDGATPTQAPCTVDRCIGACEATALVPSSAGCEFVASRLLHPREELPDGVVVSNPDPERAATVSFFQIEDGTNVEIPIETVQLDPGGSQVWEIDNDFVAGERSRLRSGGMFRIRSDYPVIAYLHAPLLQSSQNDSSLLLPDSVLGQVYVVNSYGGLASSGAGTPSYFEIIALEKNTVVEWTPPVPTYGLAAPAEVLAGETGTMLLNRYDTLRVTASNEYDDIEIADRDLSGTVITSNKPIWVVGALQCGRVSDAPGGVCDPLQELLIPVQHWGTRYVAAAPPERETEWSHWRIFAGGKDTTSFTTTPDVLTADNCAAPATLEDGVCTLPNRGAWIEISVPHGESFVVEGVTAPDDALMVVGYLQAVGFPQPSDNAIERGGLGTTSLGDSAMYQLVPAEQFLNRYVFHPGLGWPFNYVQITRPAGGETVFLDNQGVSGWETVGDFEVANVRLCPLDDEGNPIEGCPTTLEPGTHTITSAQDFGIVQMGYSDGADDPTHCQSTAQGVASCYSAYAYPGGMQSRQIWVP